MAGVGDELDDIARDSSRLHPRPTRREGTARESAKTHRRGIGAGGGEVHHQPVRLESNRITQAEALALTRLAATGSELSRINHLSVEHFRPLVCGADRLALNVKLGINQRGFCGLPCHLQVAVIARGALGHHRNLHTGHAQKGRNNHNEHDNNERNTRLAGRTFRAGARARRTASATAHAGYMYLVARLEHFSRPPGGCADGW